MYLYKYMHIFKQKYESLIQILFWLLLIIILKYFLRLYDLSW